MKKWTLIVVPRGRGSSRSFKVGSLALWVTVFVLCGLVFSTAFLLDKSIDLRGEKEKIESLNEDLESSYFLTLERQRKKIEEQAENVAFIAGELEKLYKQRINNGDLIDAGRPILSKAGGFWGFMHLDGMGGFSADIEEVVEGVSSWENLFEILSGLIEVKEQKSLSGMEAQKRRKAPSTESFDSMVAMVLSRTERVARLPGLLPVVSNLWVVTSPFGRRRDPFTGRWKLHSGTDIAAPFRSPVVATARGTIVHVGYRRSLGRNVKIDHQNGLQTLYGHLHRMHVAHGDMVERGDVIGELGTSGRSTGPHIHYEVRLGKTVLDPAKFLPRD